MVSCEVVFCVSMMVVLCVSGVIGVGVLLVLEGVVAFVLISGMFICERWLGGVREGSVTCIGVV